MKRWQGVSRPHATYLASALGVSPLFFLQLGVVAGRHARLRLRSLCFCGNAMFLALDLQPPVLISPFLAPPLWPASIHLHDTCTFYVLHGVGGTGDVLSQLAVLAALLFVLQREESLTLVQKTTCVCVCVCVCVCARACVRVCGKCKI